jgi:hypothetical protein
MSSIKKRNVLVPLHSQITTSISTIKTSTLKHFSPTLFCDFTRNFGPDAKLTYVKRNIRTKIFIQTTDKFRSLSSPVEELLRSEEPVCSTQWHNSVVKQGKRKLSTFQTTRARTTFMYGSDTRGNRSHL